MVTHIPTQTPAAKRKVQKASPAARKANASVCGEEEEDILFSAVLAGRSALQVISRTLCSSYPSLYPRHLVPPPVDAGCRQRLGRPLPGKL